MLPDPALFNQTACVRRNGAGASPAFMDLFEQPNEESIATPRLLERQRFDSFVVGPPPSSAFVKPDCRPRLDPRAAPWTMAWKMQSARPLMASTRQPFHAAAGSAKAIEP